MSQLDRVGEEKSEDSGLTQNPPYSASRCGGCKYRGEQPFDIYVHQCPLATFHCPKRPSEPKVRKERQHSYGSDAASIGSTA